MTHKASHKQHPAGAKRHQGQHKKDHIQSGGKEHRHPGSQGFKGESQPDVRQSKHVRNKK